MKPLPSKVVPCNGCTLCCQRDAVRLTADDLGRGYVTEPHPFMAGAVMVAHKPDGSCVYLADNGCSIHGHAPALCRDADCRGVAARVGFDEAIRLHASGLLDIRVWDHGRMLLEEMKNRRETDA